MGQFNVDGGLLGPFPEGHYLDLLGVGEPGLEEAHAVLEKDGEDNFIGISAGMWPVECSHHFLGNVP